MYRVVRAALGNPLGAAPGGVVVMKEQQSGERVVAGGGERMVAQAEELELLPPRPRGRGERVPRIARDQLLAGRLDRLIDSVQHGAPRVAGFGLAAVLLCFNKAHIRRSGAESMTLVLLVKYVEQVWEALRRNRCIYLWCDTAAKNGVYCRANWDERITS